MLTTKEISARLVANKLPLVTIDEFFVGNENEDSLAPNQWGYGRPTLEEIANRLRVLEREPDVDWVRVELHWDTEFDEDEGLVAAEGIAICSSASASELERRLGTAALMSDGIGKKGELDWLSDIPPIPAGHDVLFVFWD